MKDYAIQNNELIKPKPTWGDLRIVIPALVLIDVFIYFSIDNAWLV